MLARHRAPVPRARPRREPETATDPTDAGASATAGNHAPSSGRTRRPGWRPTAYCDGVAVLEVRGSVPAPQCGAGESAPYFLPNASGPIGGHLSVGSGSIRRTDPHTAPGISYVEVATGRPNLSALIGRSAGYTWPGTEAAGR